MATKKGGLHIYTYKLHVRLKLKNEHCDPLKMI